MLYIYISFSYHSSLQIDLNATQPSAPAGIDPQPVVHVITINIIIAAIVSKTFHPVLSLLLEELVLLDVVVVCGREVK